MLTGSFVTAAGFVPIGFAKSSAGEYTFSIFAVVGIALIMSWFMAVLFAPLLGVVMLTKPDMSSRQSRAGSSACSAVCWSGRCGLRWLTIGVTVACFVVAALASPLIPRQFFPPSDRPELLVDLRLPQNASIFATDDLAARLDGVLKADPDVASWSTYVGRGAIRFYLPLAVELPNDFFAQAVVIAKDVAARERLHTRLEMGARRPVSQRGDARVAARAWTARRLADPVSRQRSGRRARPATLHCSLPASCRAIRTQDTSISTGWNRPAWSGSTSTRIRPGYWASVRRRWLPC